MEVWTNIPELDGYQTTKCGKIRHNGRFVGARGDKLRWIKPKVLKHTTSGSAGYPVVSVNGSNKTVHSLVAITFLNKPKDIVEVNHKDGDKTNNNVSNLEWVTHSDNIKHAVKTGLQSSGGNSKYSIAVNQYSMDDVFIKSFDSLTEAAKAVNTSHGNISSCISKKKGQRSAAGYKWTLKQHKTTYFNP